MVLKGFMEAWSLYYDMNSLPWRFGGTICLYLRGHIFSWMQETVMKSSTYH